MVSAITIFFLDWVRDEYRSDYDNGRGGFGKGRTIRKVMGGGGGGFSARTILFFRPLLVQEFFLQVKCSARIFFFSDKYCFVCQLLIKKNYFTKELLYFVGFNNN